MSEAETVMQENTENKKGALEFTGNWFIDAGILGFVNLMEEVYGWDLNAEENNQFKLNFSNSEIEGRFMFAFWYKILLQTSIGWVKKDNFKDKELEKLHGITSGEIKHNVEKNLEKSLSKEKENIISVIDFCNKEEIKEKVISINNKIKSILENEFIEYKDLLRKKYSSNKKTIIENLNEVGFIAYSWFFTNLSVFNPGTNKKGNEEKILDSFIKLVDDFIVREKKDLPKDVLDKGLSPFTYSAEDFHNEFYGKPSTLTFLSYSCPLNPVIILLSFPWAFKNPSKNVFFYTPFLSSTYHINKKVAHLLENIGVNKRGSIFEKCFQTVMDSLHEEKALFALESLYILEFSHIENQQIKNVEYLGISKLNAKILFDNNLRKSINKSLLISSKQYNLLIESVIQEKPLFPIVLSHVYAAVNNPNTYLSVDTSFYSLMIDANKQNLNDTKLHFNPIFFKNYPELNEQIKKDVNHCSFAGNALRDLMDLNNETKLHETLSLIQNKNKCLFLDSILRVVLEAKNEKKRIIITNFLMNKIINNEHSWEKYALAIIIPVVRKWKQNRMRTAQ